MTEYQIQQSRLERLMGADFHLREGKGKGINGGVDACLLQSVHWLTGGDGSSDHPECTSPLLAGYCIRLNDSKLFREHRDMLKPFAPKLVGTVAVPEVEQQRAFIAADYAVRIFTPKWMRILGKVEWAEKLEACSPIVDRETAIEAKKATAEVKKAAAAAAYAYAYADAYADADAAAAAYAYADAYADAYAAAAAYAYADAYADAYAYAVAYKKALPEDLQYLREKSLECLDKMISVKLA
jgi:hypothetical protein